MNRIIAPFQKPVATPHKNHSSDPNGVPIQTPTLANSLQLSLTRLDDTYIGAITIRVISSSLQSETVTASHAEELDRAVLWLFEKAPGGIVIVELMGRRDKPSKNFE